LAEEKGVVADLAHADVDPKKANEIEMGVQEGAVKQ